MHEKVLPRNSRRLLGELAQGQARAMSGWILAGGTGLALRLGHRLSADFDFFRQAGMVRDELHDAIGQLGKYETLQDSEGTLTVLVHKVKLSFFQIRDPFLFAPEPYSFFAVAEVRDIALMKLVAIANRGSRRDFVDLYTLLRSGPLLQDYFQLLPSRYGRERINPYHILKSLTYFTDAEAEPLPKMLEPFDWKECRAFLVRAAHAIVLP